MLLLVILLFAGGHAQSGDDVFCNPLAPQTIDLLDPNLNSSPLQPSSKGAYTFSGVQGFQIKAGVPSPSSSFSVTVEFTMLNNTFGYLMAKSDGSLRFYALYYSNTAKLLYFYYALEQGSQRQLTFSSTLNDGKRHAILFSMDDGQLTFVLDGETLAQTLFASDLGDCELNATLSCQLHVGQRAGILSTASPTLIMTGTIHSLQLYPCTALTAFPALPSTTTLVSTPSATTLVSTKAATSSTAAPTTTQTLTTSDVAVQPTSAASTTSAAASSTG